MMNKELVDLLRQKQLHISFAESATGGMLASLVTDVPGASDILGLSFVTYSNEAKMELLDVKEATIEQFGVVSKEVAKEMVFGLANISLAEVGVSITGYAGPRSSDEEVGLAFVGLRILNKTYLLKIETKLEDRDTNRRIFCQEIFKYLVNKLKSE